MSQPPGYPPPAGAPSEPPAPSGSDSTPEGHGASYGPGSAQPPEPRRAALITSIVLGVVLLLCAGGGTTAYFLITRVGSHGQSTPSGAVDGFLDAVFNQRD